MVYLDHNATTPCDPQVVDAMEPYVGRLYGNPSSLYRLGRIGRSAIDTAREQVAALVDAAPGQVVFTSGGTESNALAIRNGFGRAIAISAIEHPSVFENVAANRDRFITVKTIGVDGNGAVDLDVMDQISLPDNCFVSVMLANNETGAIQNIPAVVELLSSRSPIIHTDAVQALGKIEVSFRQLGVDMMSISSHKIYGPKGCGALLVKDHLDFHPLQFGGEQERGFRAGTENVAAIVGFGKAAELAKVELGQRKQKAARLKALLEHKLRQIDGMLIFAEAVDRLPNTIQFAIPNVDGEMLLMQLDRQDFAVSSGSACKVGSEEISPVLAAMAVKPELARSAIRVSLGKDNTEEDVERFVQVLTNLIQH